MRIWGENVRNIDAKSVRGAKNGKHQRKIGPPGRNVRNINAKIEPHGKKRNEHQRKIGNCETSVKPQREIKPPGRNTKKHQRKIGPTGNNVKRQRKFGTWRKREKPQRKIGAQGNARNLNAKSNRPAKRQEDQRKIEPPGNNVRIINAKFGHGAKTRDPNATSRYINSICQSKIPSLKSDKMRITQKDCYAEIDTLPSGLYFARA